MSVISRYRKRQAELMPREEAPSLSASDAMIHPCFLFPDDTAETILKKLRKEHINACIVVTKEKRFVGEITDNDIIALFLQQVKHEPLVQILNQGYRREFLYKKAKEMANTHTASVREDTPINDVIKLIFKEDFTYIPVLDNEEKVVGVVTPSSLIQILKDC